MCMIITFFTTFMYGLALASNPISPILLQPTDPTFYETLQKEISTLTLHAPSFGQDKGKVNLALAENIRYAPTMHTYLTRLVETLISKTKINMPIIHIYVGDAADSYNASMQKVSRTTTTTRSIRGKYDVTSVTTNEYHLTIGKELINLFFWQNKNKRLLPAVIAHEIGHAVNNHVTQSKTNEFEADATAIKILDDPQTLPRAIDMITLAGHMYNNIATISPDAPKKYVHDLVRIMTSSLVQEFPDLGKLGTMTSHHNLAFAIYSAIEPLLKPEATAGNTITLDTVIAKAYGQLKEVCIAPEKYLGTNQDLVSAKGKLLDALTSAHFSPIVHPDPKSRRENMEYCFARQKTS